jgi:hypothetical protein
MTVFHAGWEWLASTPHQRRGLRVLQSAIGAVLLFRICTEGRFALYLWGPRGLGWGSTQPALGPTLGRLADRSFGTDAGTVGVVLALVAAALGLLLGWRPRLSTAVALIALSLLERRLPEIIDRGDTAARLALFYLLFVVPAGATVPPRGLAVWIHNLGVLAIAAQTMIIYGTAGLMKAAGREWYDGTALYYISQVDSLSLPAMWELARVPLVTVVGSYFTVAYEALFPVAVLSPLRLVWIALGVLFHLAIAVFLGLITFSTVMIALDLFFVTDSEYARALAWGSRSGRYMARITRDTMHAYATKRQMH